MSAKIIEPHSFLFCEYNSVQHVVFQIFCVYNFSSILYISFSFLKNVFYVQSAENQ